MRISSDHRGFSIVEIITSITIFVIFATGYTLLMSQDNTSSEADAYLFSSSQLINEAQEVIRNVGAANFSSGSWSMTSSSWVYTFYSGATLSGGLYVNSFGQWVTVTATGAYKRLIVISTNNAIYTGSTAKSITIPSLSVDIQMWYPGCDFNRSYCAHRSIITY